MKERYIKPELEIKLFDTEDIITSSDPFGADDPDQGQPYPWNER